MPLIDCLASSITGHKSASLTRLYLWVGVMASPATPWQQICSSDNYLLRICHVSGTARHWLINTQDVSSVEWESPKCLYFVLATCALSCPLQSEVLLSGGVQPESSAPGLGLLRQRPCLRTEGVYHCYSTCAGVSGARLGAAKWVQLESRWGWGGRGDMCGHLQLWLESLLNPSLTLISLV